MKRCSDKMKGKKFGKLTVKEIKYGYRLKENSKPRTFCVCECECGNEVALNAFDVRSGYKQSCGCDSSERRSIAYRLNLVGHKNHRLIVLETLYGSKVRCLCDCGNEVIVSTADFLSGHSKSCGCLRDEKLSKLTTKDYTGVVSAYDVKILHRSYKNSKNQWLWECECGLCGKRFTDLPARILNGHVTSCGCRKQSSREQLIEHILKRENVNYKSQYSTPACKDKQVLLFDFAIFRNNKLTALVEYDGEQHFKAIDFYGGEKNFQNTCRRDKIKDDYCKRNKISLHRLPYTMTDKEIEDCIMSIIYP